MYETILIFLTHMLTYIPSRLSHPPLYLIPSNHMHTIFNLFIQATRSSKENKSKEKEEREIQSNYGCWETETTSTPRGRRTNN